MWMAFLALSGSALAASKAEYGSAAVPTTSPSTNIGAITPPLVKPAAITPAVTVSYSYDSLGRVIQETAGTRTSSFTYDAAGNRTQATQ